MIKASEKSVSILGCGWLGFPLAESLIQTGWRVKGSVTHREMMNRLLDARIEAYHVHCSPECRGEQLDNFFKSRILVITIPFRRDFVRPEVYLEQIHSVLSRAKAAGVDFIVFTSSTSVYPDDIDSATEDLKFTPQNPRAATLFDIENLLMSGSGIDATIVRLAGLYGYDRRIGRFLSGRQDLPDGHHPVNLIHRDDAVQIIVEIIRQNFRNEIFNACSDAHPSRQELYTAAAVRAGFPAPVFSGGEGPRGKIVVSDKIKARLGYRFKYPDPMEVS